MLLVVNMTRAANDNEPFAMISIGLAAELILNKLRVRAQLETSEQHQKHCERDADSNAADEDNGAGNDQEIPNRIGNRS
jgi:hypothetical protein